MMISRYQRIMCWSWFESSGYIPMQLYESMSRPNFHKMRLRIIKIDACKIVYICLSLYINNIERVSPKNHRSAYCVIDFEFFSSALRFTSKQ